MSNAKNKKTVASVLSVAITAILVAAITITVILLLRSCDDDPDDKYKLTLYDGERVIDTIEYDKDSTVPAPDTTQEKYLKEGHTFEKWYQEVELTNEFTFPFVIKEDTSVYAKYIDNSIPVKYTVTFYDGASVLDQIKDVEAGTVIQRPADYIKDGYIFNNWYVEETFITEFTFPHTVVSDVSIYAKYDLDETDMRASVTFYGLNLRVLHSRRVNHEDGVQEPTLSDFDWREEHHDFLGWYANTECTTSFAFPYTCGPQEVISIYGSYKIHSYDVTFKLHNGQPDIVEKVDHGKMVPVPLENPIRVNFVFVGWYTQQSEGTKYDFSTPITNAITLHAQYSSEDVAIYISAVEYKLDSPINPIEFTITYSVPAGFDEDGLSNFTYEVGLNDKLFEYIKFKNSANQSIEGTWVDGVLVSIPMEWKAGKNPSSPQEYNDLVAILDQFSISISASIDISFQDGVSPRSVFATFID